VAEGEKLQAKGNKPLDRRHSRNGGVQTRRRKKRDPGGKGKDGKKVRGQS